MRRFSLLFAVLAFASLASPGFAQIKKNTSTDQASDSQDNRVILSADHVAYDNDLNLVTARGNVQLAQGTQVLTADVVSYNQNEDLVTASGHVVIKDQDGNIFFGDYAELKDQMSTGFMDQVKALLVGNARLVSNTANRRDDRYVDMDHAVYTACQLCADNPMDPPIWQLKARSVTHDSEDQELVYHDATLEFDGVPVVYTPYFSNPDPDVKQRSGFLAPVVGTRSNLGLVDRNYYYYGIDPSQDATIEGTYASDQGPLLGGEYRNRFDYGKLVLSGSIAEGKDQGFNPGTIQENTVRGHIFGLGVYDLDDNWRTGFNLARTSDDIYLRNYGYSDQDVLDSRAYVEGFFDRDYAVANIYSTQDLRPDIPGVQPIAAPYANYEALGEQGATAGGRWSFDSGLLDLTRRVGQDTGRVSTNEGWQRSVTADGFTTTVDGHLFGDGYVTNNQPVILDEAVDQDSGGDFSGRVLPQVHAVTGYPLVKPAEDGHYLIEPQGSFAFAPTGLARNNKIPNEDSQDLELDQTNIFDANRFPGIDRIEDGAHVAYGVKSGYYADTGGYATVFAGQSQRLTGEDIFPTNSGLDTAESDYVGGVNLYPGKYVTLNYTTRLAPKDFSSKLHEVNLGMTPVDGTTASLTYLFLASIPSISAGQNRNSLSPSLSQKVSQYWTFSGSFTSELGDGGRVQQVYTTTTYQDDCLTVQIQASRDLTNSLGGLAGTSVFFRVGLRTLGFFQSPNFAGMLNSAIASTPGS
jgi:LPS-assembly protein